MIESKAKRRCVPSQKPPALVVAATNIFIQNMSAKNFRSANLSRGNREFVVPNNGCWEYVATIDRPVLLSFFGAKTLPPVKIPIINTEHRHVDFYACAILENGQLKVWLEQNDKVTHLTEQRRIVDAAGGSVFFDPIVISIHDTETNRDITTKYRVSVEWEINGVGYHDICFSVKDIY